MNPNQNIKRPMITQSAQNGINPTLAELIAMRQHLEDLQEEVIRLRDDLRDKKTLKIGEQVANAVVRAGIVLYVFNFFVRIMLEELGRVTVQGGSKKKSDMRSDEISTETSLDLIFSR